MEKKTVLITGGSGTVGKRLSELLVQKGYEVRHLSRKRNLTSKHKTYLWNLQENIIEPEALFGVRFIVHLAGENISAKRWSAKRKQLLIDSRVKTAELLKQKLLEQGVHLSAFISASGTGYYNANSGATNLSEDAAANTHFLGNCCVLWESAADNFSPIAERVVKLRMPMVLTKEDGVLKKLSPLIRCGIGVAFGSGKQIVTWVHIDDLCYAFLASIENDSMKGAYNVVASEQVSSKSFIGAIAKVLKRPFFLPNAPSFLLRILVGEMSCVLLEGCNISSQKLMDTGFVFKFDNLDKALKNVLRSKK